MKTIEILGGDEISKHFIRFTIYIANPFVNQKQKETYGDSTWRRNLHTFQSILHLHSESLCSH